MRAHLPLVVVAFGALAATPPPRPQIVATPPKGFEMMPANTPGLDAATRKMIESGDIFLFDTEGDGALIAHPSPAGTDPTDKQACSEMAAVFARGAGLTVVAVEVEALPFAKACRIDLKAADGTLSRQLRWRLSPTLSVTVSCMPYLESKLSAKACMTFAGSVRAAKKK